MFGPNHGHNGLWISETPRIKLIDDPRYPKLKAFSSIVLNESFRVCSIRVVKIGDRLIVAFPSKQKEDGGHYDLCHPLDDATRRHFETPILHAYCDERARAIRDDAAARPELYGLFTRRLQEAC
jgi:stage V sporulation protein G